MNIVFLTGAYYPTMSPATVCVDKYIQVLKREHRILIVCQRDKYDIRGFNDAGITLFQVDNWWMRLRVYCRHQMEQGKFRWIYRFVDVCAIAFNVSITPFVYPSGMNYLIDAYNDKLERLWEKEHFDAVFCTHHPICACIAGMKFKRRHPEVRFINYFTDPVADEPSYYRFVCFKSKRYARYLQTEKDLCESADGNLFTEELFQSFASKYPMFRDKFFSFPYVLSQYQSIRGHIAPANPDRIIMLYAGAFWQRVRNPEYMLQTLSKITNADVHVYSRYGDCEDILKRYQNNDNNIVIYPPVSRTEYLELINNGDILISLGNNCDLQAPSKTMELLSTGRPIIHFYYKEDIQYMLMKRYPLCLTIKIGSDNVGSKIEKFIQETRGKRLEYSMVERIFPEHVLSEQMERIERILS